MKQGDALDGKSKKALLEIAICEQRTHRTETKNLLSTILLAIQQIQFDKEAFMAEVTMQVAAAIADLKAAGDALVVRIDKRLAEQTSSDAMDQKEADPLLLQMRDFAASLGKILPDAPVDLPPAPTPDEPTTAEPV